jgi:hypothetical protein
MEHSERLKLQKAYDLPIRFEVLTRILIAIMCYDSSRPVGALMLRGTYFLRLQVHLF